MTEKQKQFNQFVLIVTGMRLFNKNCKKGGAGIDNSNFFNFYFNLNKL